jgi:Brp/Blh family beta-carotene 15,15'-monooxygenase
MLHGANDLKLIQHAQEEVQGKFHFYKVLAAYVLVILLVFVFFYFLPVLAFIVFLVVSGYHFGEQHWVSKLKVVSIWSKLFFCAYGLFVLFLLFYFHSDKVIQVVYKLTEVTTTSNDYYLVTLITGLLTVLFYIILKMRKELEINVVKELFFLVIFTVVFHTASLLWSFAIYFILWHSLPSIADQITFLHGTLDKESILKYLKSSFLYWIVAAASSALLLYIFKDDMEVALSFFIAFLAAITIPHVIVISRLNHH